MNQFEAAAKAFGPMLAQLRYGSARRQTVEALSHLLAEKDGSACFRPTDEGRGKAAGARLRYRSKARELLEGMDL